MSDIQDYQGTGTAGRRNEGQPEIFDGITYKGEKTDFRFDPGAAVKKTWINFNKPVKLAFEDKTTELKPKSEQNSFAFLSRTAKEIPSNKGYAERVGFKNPDALALAIEHYAATEEYIRNMEAEEAEEE